MISEDKTTLEFNQKRPNIDIFKISYFSTDENKVQLFIAIDGFIQESDDTKYVMWYNTTNASYCIKYANGTNTGWAMALDTGEKFAEVENVSVDSHTIIATYDLYGTNATAVELWGYAAEDYFNGTTQHMWVDYVPDEFCPYNETGENNNGDDETTTSGFETIAVILALTVVFIILRRKK
jgi:hypothetical protein